MINVAKRAPPILHGMPALLSHDVIDMLLKIDNKCTFITASVSLP